MPGAGAEAPTRRTGVGRSEDCSDTKIRVVQVLRQVLKTATSAEGVAFCVGGLGSTIDVEMAAVKSLFNNYVPVDEALDDAAGCQIYS